MKIVHIVEPLSGGIATFLKLLVEQLPDDSHIVIHGERKEEISSLEVRKQFPRRNVKFLRWKSAQRKLRLKDDIAATIELYNILKRLKYNGLLDVVHLHSSKGGFIGRLVSRMLGIQDLVVYTPNGAPFLSNASRISNYMYKRLEKLAATFGGQIVCCSASEQKAYEMAGIDVLMINNGTENKKQVVSRGKRKKNKVFRIVTSGRIVHQKNPAMFNKIATYFEEFKQFEFVWIGDGCDRDQLTAKNITVTGWLEEQSDINNILEDADIYLSTARFEGLPFAVLEALVLKKAVLLSDCVGNRDLVTKGLNGSIFKHESEAINKILQFYNNTSMLAVMGEHSGLHCKNAFDNTDTGKGYKSLYQKAAFKNTSFAINLNQLAHGRR